MKIQCILITAALLLGVMAGPTRADEKSAVTRKTAAEVQASADKPRPGRGSLTGTVVDESGKSVGAAIVELTDAVTKEAPSSVTTDEKGNYKFSGLLPGAYKIQAKKEGMESNSQNTKVNNGPSTGPRLVLKAKKT